MKSKEDIDFLYKLIDSIYKKLLVLIAIAGGFGAYTISFLRDGNAYGYVFAIVFFLVSIAIFISYTKLNQNIKELEKQNG